VSIGAEITRIIAPSSTYGWLVLAGDVMLDLVVRNGEVQRLDSSTGFLALHTNDLKRLAALRIDDMLKLLNVSRSEVKVETIYLEIPDTTYEMLWSEDYALQNSGFNDLMVWVGKEKMQV
jgi:hypothetical protein